MSVLYCGIPPTKQIEPLKSELATAKRIAEENAVLAAERAAEITRLKEDRDKFRTLYFEMVARSLKFVEEIQ